MYITHISCDFASFCRNKDNTHIKRSQQMRPNRIQEPEKEVDRGRERERESEREREIKIERLSESVRQLREGILLWINLVRNHYKECG